VAAASAWVRSFGKASALDSNDIFRLDLCVTELVTNIVDHGDPRAAGQAIELHASAARTFPGVQIDIIDAGPPFDPFAARSDPPDTGAQNARIGGSGLRLIASFADECRYSRRDRYNVAAVLVRKTPDVPARHGADGARTARGPERRRNPDTQTYPLTRADGKLLHADQRSPAVRRKLGFLSACTLFRNVPYHLIEDLVADLPLRSFADGELLLKPGDSNHYLALVVQGSLRVHLGARDASDYTEIGPGDCAGEMSMIDGKAVSAYVFAAGDCRLLLIDDQTFLTRLLPIPEIARNLVATLAERMRHGNQQIVERVRSALELESLQRELQFAREMQLSLVPERMTLAPPRAEVQCSGYMRPARQVGGDFYDAFYVRPERLAVIMGDVCGKGMPAALFMARTMALLRSEALHAAQRTQRQHTLEIAQRTNFALCQQNTAGYFVSVFVAVLDIPSGLLTWVNAGHPAPLLARGSNRFQLLATPHGMLAGVSENASYVVGETPLPPGSLLLLYTDGVTEAEDTSGALFGEERLLDLLNSAPRADPESTLRHVVNSVDAFARGRALGDDLTLLALRYTNGR